MPTALPPGAAFKLPAGGARWVRCLLHRLRSLRLGRSMLLLSAAEVEQVLDLDDLVNVLGAAMVDLSRGRASMPSRIAATVQDVHGWLGVMPAYLPSARALTTKLVSLFPGNTDRPTHQAVVVCFDPSTGTPSALMDGTYLTAARTAGGSALATRLLARDDARVLAVLGTGVQARAHARAVVRVRPIESVVVAGRSRDRAESLAGELQASLNVPCRVAVSFQDAVQQADIVCATTHSPEPVLMRAWLAGGTHVNSVGYNTDGREIDAAVVADARVVVEARAAALAPPPAGSNDLTRPIRDGVVTADHFTEIGEILGGDEPGRTSADQITLYKSVGVAVQDAAAAALVLRDARRRGVGREVEL